MEEEFLLLQERPWASTGLRSWASVCGGVVSLVSWMHLFKRPPHIHTARAFLLHSCSAPTPCPVSAVTDQRGPSALFLCVALSLFFFLSFITKLERKLLGLAVS